jgi:hypothetical protein
MKKTTRALVCVASLRVKNWTETLLNTHHKWLLLISGLLQRTVGREQSVCKNKHNFDSRSADVDVTLMKFNKCSENLCNKSITSMKLQLQWFFSTKKNYNTVMTQSIFSSENLCNKSITTMKLQIQWVFSTKKNYNTVMTQSIFSL